MTRDELLDKLATAFAEEEGFFVTQEQAKQRGIRWPTKAQKNCNPGNIRGWSRNGVAYPRAHGFVDFSAWAGDKVKGLAEGWRVLKSLIGQYIDGKYTKGKPPSLYEFLAVYAPASDGNDPVAYAEHVAERAGLDPSRVLKEYFTPGVNK